MAFPGSFRSMWNKGGLMRDIEKHARHVRQDIIKMVYAAQSGLKVFEVEGDVFEPVAEHQVRLFV